LHDLVYIKYNQQLAQRYNIRDEIDPIVLNEIDECNEWLVGQVDDDNGNEKVGNELVFDDDPTLNWATVYEASGLGEPITYTRRQAFSKRKQPSSGGIVIGSSQASKKGPSVTSTSTKKGKENIQIGVENELHDSSDSEFERLLNYKSCSEREEEEGYASLDNIEENYTDIEKESDS